MKTPTLAAILLAASSAVAERLPLQQDFDRCTLAAENRSEILTGRARLELLVAKSGSVYAAFIHSAPGLEQNARFLHCLSYTALLWQLPEVSTDYERPYVMSFVHGGTQIDFTDINWEHGDSYNVPGRTSAFMPDMNDPAPVLPPDVALAQQTLEVNDHASDAERGTALLAVRDYPKAIASFRSALDRDASDVVALRGLSHALAASGGDLKEARSAAEKLVAIAPAAAAGHEALLHVCLAAGDDGCAVAEFRAAKRAPDLAVRSRAIAELQDGVRKAAQRLATAGGRRTDDPCGRVAGEGEQALCVVRGCLDDGTAAYARELSEQNHVALTAGEWRSQRVAADRYVVHRAIEGGGERHDAIWLVTVGDELTMKPASGEARQITLRHNHCAARTLGSR